MNLERPQLIERPNGTIVRPNPKKDRQWRRRRPHPEAIKALAKTVRDRKGQKTVVGYIRMLGCSLRAMTSKQVTKPSYMKDGQAFREAAKKAAMLIACLTLLSGCNYKNYPCTSKGGTDYAIDEVDGCQYLKFYTSDGNPVLTHKGDCNNRIHGHFTAEAR